MDTRRQVRRRPLLDICIPTRNRAGYLDLLLSQLSEGISNSDLSADINVIVSDNSSDDATSDVLALWREREESWTLTTTPGNIGAAANYKLLIKKSAADFVWVFGDDDELVSDTSLKDVVWLLRETDPDLLLLAEVRCPDWAPPELNFNTPREFLVFVADHDPDAIRRSTWISAQVFRRIMITPPGVTPSLTNEYALSYGIWRGLALSQKKVVVRRTPTVRPRPVAGHRDPGAFPSQASLRLEWALFYNYISREFDVPKLRKFARRWSPKNSGTFAKLLKALARGSLRFRAN